MVRSSHGRAPCRPRASLSTVTGEIERLTTPAEFQDAVAGPPAVIYLTVEWSQPERRSRAVFREAVQRWAASNKSHGIRFLSVCEDDTHVQDWLRAQGHHVGIGSGTVIVTSRGAEVAYHLNAAFGDLAAVFELARQKSEHHR